MDPMTLRLLTRDKLVNRRLPHEPLPRICGGPGQGETCAGCGDTVARSERGIEDAGTEHPIH